MSDFLESLTQDERTLDAFRQLENGAFVRVLNFHNTAEANRDRIYDGLARLAEHFCPVSVADIDQWFLTRKWQHDRPGLIVSVYEGWRCHYDVMLDCLDRAGLRGWFFIPAFLRDVPPSEQTDFAASHRLRRSAVQLYADGRYAMNAAEIREVAKRHEICCHTGTHFSPEDGATAEELEREVVSAKAYLEETVGRSVDVFCWCSGEEYGQTVPAHPYLKRAGYRYVLSNTRIERIGQ